MSDSFVDIKLLSWSQALYSHNILYGLGLFHPIPRHCQCMVSDMVKQAKPTYVMIVQRSCETGAKVVVYTNIICILYVVLYHKITN